MVYLLPVYRDSVSQTIPYLTHVVLITTSTSNAEDQIFLNACHFIFYFKYLVCIFIVAFLENAAMGYSLESVCVCVCVFLHDNSKRNRSRNTKSEYIVVYENSSDEFDIELHRIKVKVTVGVQKFSPFTTIQTVRSYSSTLVQARNFILSIYLHLILIYKIYECRHA